MHPLLRASLTSLGAKLGPLLLVLWAVGMLAVCTIMLGRHMIPLPTQSAPEARVAEALARARPDQGDDHWMLVHVLYTTCPCSGRITDHLLESERPEGAVELVLLVGDDVGWRAPLEARGYRVEELTSEELEQSYHLQAAPLLAILDPLDQLRYLGGYTQRKQGLAIEDLQILSALEDELTVTSLPLFGCAVSRELRQRVDPTGLF